MRKANELARNEVGKAGLSAIGQLLAYSAPELEDGTINSDSVEALGWLLSTLGELGAQMAILAVHCGRAAGRSE